MTRDLGTLGEGSESDQQGLEGVEKVGMVCRGELSEYKFEDTSFSGRNTIHSLIFVLQTHSRKMRPT